jgi:putative membrane protein insertion efficiency factor
MVSAAGCGRAAGEPCFGPVEPVAGSGSRPDLARPRPCDLRGPRSGSPAPGRPGIPALFLQRIPGPTAGCVRRRPPRGFGRRPQPDSTAAARRRGSLRRRPRRRRRLLVRCGARSAEPRIQRPVRGRLVGAPARPKDDAAMTAPQAAPAPAVKATIAARLLMLPVRAWRLVSVHLPPRCRFHPSCSQYALDALTLHGARRGSWLAIRRVGRCHPWHPGGFDPVPEPNVRSTHVLPQT